MKNKRNRSERLTSILLLSIFCGHFGLIECHNLIQNKRITSCTNKPNGYVFGDSLSENKYWTCIQGKAYKSECKSYERFSETTATCEVHQLRNRNKSMECEGRQDGHMVANREYCQSYWLCWNEQKIARQCAPNYNFNEDAQQCENSIQFPCIKSEVMAQYDSRCPLENPDYVIMLPSEEDCQKYYICLDGKAHPYWCLDNLYWDPEKEACNLPENVECNITSEEESPVIPITCPSGPGIYVYSYHGDCNRYYLCSSGIPHIRHCADGLIFNPIISNCYFPHSFDCPFE